MSSGFIRWYQSSWSAGAVQELVDSLEGAGWMMAHPQTKIITRFTDQGRTAVSRVQLLEDLAVEADDGDELMQWWLNGDDTDVGYSIRRLTNGGVAHEFDLDGVGEHLRKIERDVLALVRDQITDTTAIICDRYGASQETDWDAIVSGTETHPDPRDLPNLIGLTREIDRRHPYLTDHYPTRTVGNLVIHDRDGLWPAD